MIKAFSQSIVLALVAVVVAACGGGGSGGGSGDGGDKTSDELVTFDSVDSVAKQTSGDGVAMDEAAQYTEARCGGSPADRYLETDKVIVYGTRDASEKSLQRLANAIHNYYPKVLESMSVSDDFEQTQLSVTANHFIRSFEDTDSFDNIEGALASETSFSGTIEDEGDAMAELLKLTPAQLESVIRTAIDTSSGSSGHDSLMQVESYNGPVYSRRYEPQKMVACVDTSVDRNSGSSSIWGVTVGDRFEASVAHHEIVHYVQKRLSGTSLAFATARWFTEGQATVLSGQHVAGEDRIGDFNPVNVESTSYEQDNNLTDNNPYPLYGLAYEYIADQTNPEAFNQVLSHSFMTIEAFEAQGQEQVNFRNGFDSEVVDPQGDPLNYSDYQNEWEQRIQDYL